MIKKRLIACAPLLSFCCVSSAFAFESYTPPEAINLVSPNYPISSAMLTRFSYSGRGRRPQKVISASRMSKRERERYSLATWKGASSGMVILEYIVNTDGKAEHIIVLDSTRSMLERPAIKALSKSTFKPADNDGTKVDARDSAVIFFSVEEESSGVSERFKKRYQALKKRLAQNDDKELKRVGRGIKRTLEEYRLNLYSLAWLYQLQWEYAAKLGSLTLQQQALEKLTALESRFADDEGFLNQHLRAVIRREQVLLDIRVGKVGLALERYKNLKAFSKEVAAEIEPLIKEVVSTIESDKPFSQDFEIGERGFWLDALSRRQLKIGTEKGKVEKLAFRCEKKFFEVTHKEENQYRIPASWGDCRVQVIGEHKSRGRLVQL